MKHLRLVLLVLLPCFACTPRSIRQSLDRAESYINTGNPDSAVFLLNEFSIESLQLDPVRARYGLLITEAKDKCHIDVVDDSLIEFSVQWYRKHGSEQEYLKAVYYQGVVNQNAQNIIPAAFYFQEAESEAAKLREYRWQSLSQQHLSAIYSSNYDYVRAKAFAEKAYNSAIMSGDSLMAEYCQWDIAKQCISEGKYEEARNRLIQLRSHTKDPFLYTQVTRSLAKAMLDGNKRDYSGAWSCYQEILQLDSLHLSRRDYGYLALLMEWRGDSGNGNYYKLKAEQSMGTAVDSVSFYSILHDIYQLRGDTSKAYEAYERAMSIQNEIVFVQLGQSVTHALEEYNKNLFSFEQEKNRLRSFLFCTTGLLLLCVIVWLIKVLSDSKKEMLAKMVQIQDFSREIEYLQSEKSDSRHLLEYYSKERIRSLNSLALAYFSWDNDLVRSQAISIEDKTKDEMLKEFQKQLKAFQRDDKLYESLEKFLNVYHDNLMVRAREELKSLKNVDFELLILFFSRFSIKSICFLKDMRDATVWMRKTRIKQFFASLPDHRGEEFVRQLERVE